MDRKTIACKTSLFFGSYFKKVATLLWSGNNMFHNYTLFNLLLLHLGIAVQWQDANHQLIEVQSHTIVTNWVADSKSKWFFKIFKLNLVFCFVLRCLLQNVGSNPGRWSCGDCEIERSYDPQTHCFSYLPMNPQFSHAPKTTSSHITALDSCCNKAIMYSLQVFECFIHSYWQKIIQICLWKQS